MEEIMTELRDLMKKTIADKPAYVAGRTIEQAKKDNGGIEMIKLGSNENLMGPSPKAIEAMKEAASEMNTYPDPMAMDLCAKLAEYYHLKTGNIVCANGSSTILDVISRVFLNPGDEVLYCEPTFQIYEMFAKEAGAVCVGVPLDENLKFDLKALKAAITEKTKLLMICNPNNPTASYLPGEELAAFIKELPDRIICVIDEAYIEYATSEDCVSMIPLIEDYRVIVTRTFSKIWGLAGARLGYAIASEEISSLLRANVITFNVNKMVIAAAKASLDDKEFLESTWKENKEGKEFLTEKMKGFGWKVWSSETNFIYVTETGLEPAYIAAEMEKRGVIIRGNMGFIRLTIGNMEQNRIMAAAFEDILKKG